MVTQAGREALIMQSIRCFVEQSFSEKELVIVHDEDENFHHFLEEFSAQFSRVRIRVFRELEGQSLGCLRNQSIEAAHFDYICQWDDDDLYHPDRLKLQFEYLQREQADFCFLGDQLHLFSQSNIMFWDDWSTVGFPGNLIQGSLLGKKSKIGRYPDLQRGEDTPLLFRLVDEHHKLSILRGKAWLYIYVFHGKNAWDEDHHKKISKFNRLNHHELADRIDEVLFRLLEYTVEIPCIELPHEKGKYVLNLETGVRSDYN